MTNSVKLLIVAAQGGGRADMTAGWLNMLPGYVNGRWIIDIDTGVSYGNMGMIRGIDTGEDLLSVVKRQGVTLSSRSDSTWAVAIHGYNIDYLIYKKFIDSGEVAFVCIDTAGADQKTLAWEFYVKTYLSDRLSLDSLRGWSEQWIIGNGLDNSEKTTKLKSMLRLHRFDRHTSSLPPAVPCIKLDYIKMFVPGGSRYLCGKLGIAVDEKYHEYWDAVLPFTHSPDTLDVWGTIWHRQDWFPD